MEIDIKDDEILDITAYMQNDFLKGEQGPEGEQGKPGKDGQPGQDGKDGQNYEITEKDYRVIAELVEKLVNVPKNTSQLKNDSGFITKEVNNLTNYINTENLNKEFAKKIEIKNEAENTVEIEANKFYKFGEVAELTLTLKELTDSTIYNEYMFEFISGEISTTLTLPDEVKWLEEPTIEPNKIYQCSIVENVGVLLGVSNE